MPVDTAALMAEIDEEVRRRRRSGDLADFERELDRTFARFAPVDALEADFDTILAKVERAAVIDTRPPTVSARPGVATVKQGVAKASGFYIRHVATQVSSLVQALTRALRLLDERMTALERQIPANRGDLWRGLAGTGVAGAAAPALWTDLVVRQLAAGAGRVLHAEAGDGRLVAGLLAAGVDAYGVEPAEDLADDASDRAADIRTDDVVAHLELLAPRTLGGVILSGCVERFGARQLMDLAALATSRLSPGGVLVVISAHPRAWARSASPVTVDLAEGRPLHPETWSAILAALGCSSIEIHPGPGEELTALDASEAGAEITNANMAHIEAVLFGPDTYAVTAVAAR